MHGAMTPDWLRVALADVGEKEIPGARTAPKIASWLDRLGAWWRDDETPWCGVAIAAWMTTADVITPRQWYRARGWLNWGTPIAAPAVGCVVVFERAGGGHVGLVVGKDDAGRLLVVGGNQGNAVSVAPFDSRRVIGYRWPTERMASLSLSPLPVIVAAGPASQNEA